MAASRCAERRKTGRGKIAVASAALLALCTGAGASDVDPAYWLKYGRAPRLCPGARTATPYKLQGATWGVLASGVLLCRDAGDAYALTVDYLNVSIDPDDHGMLPDGPLSFDWIGLTLYAPRDGGRAVDWLFDGSQPIKGQLRRDSTGRIVFGHLTFDVPKAAADRADHMLLYVTFGGPLVAIDVL